MDQVKSLPQWQDWMENWLFFDEDTAMYSTYDVDNERLYHGDDPLVAIQAFQLSTATL